MKTKSIDKYLNSKPDILNRELLEDIYNFFVTETKTCSPFLTSRLTASTDNHGTHLILELNPYDGRSVQFSYSMHETAYSGRDIYIMLSQVARLMYWLES